MRSERWLATIRSARDEIGSDQGGGAATGGSGTKHDVNATLPSREERRRTLRTGYGPDAVMVAVGVAVAVSPGVTVSVGPPVGPSVGLGVGLGATTGVSANSKRPPI